MKFKCELKKIKSNHENLRTNEIEGITDSLPMVGEEFIMIGSGLEFGHRQVYTTKVQSCFTEDDNLVFHTRNSTYKLKYEKISDQESSDWLNQSFNGLPGQNDA